MLLNLVISTLFLMFLFWIGVILMFVDAQIYWVIPCFFLFLWMSNFFYKENCKTFEYKDFLYAVAFTLLSVGVLSYRNQSVSLGGVCYIFLCVFLANMMFASSLRYKSLM